MTLHLVDVRASNMSNKYYLLTYLLIFVINADLLNIISSSESTIPFVPRYIRIPTGCVTRGEIKSIHRVC